MYLRRQILLTKTKYVDERLYAEKLSINATALYNAALFRIRQVFTGWDKTVLSDNEAIVFDELEALKEYYPSLNVRRVLTYNVLDKWMRANNIPEYFNGLPSHTAQRVLKQAVEDFKGWLSTLKVFKKEPSLFTGRPKMPGYKHIDTLSSFVISNQEAVLYPVYDKDGNITYHNLKLPKRRKRIKVSGLPEDFKLINVIFKPLYDSWVMFLDFEVDDVDVNDSNTNLAGIDFGISNIAAIVLNDGSSLIYKGGALKSEIRLYAKSKAEAVSRLTKGKRAYSDTHYLNRLALNYYNFTNDQCHKISRHIINTCIEHNIGTLVLGVNKYWKQKCSIGKGNNQMFNMMPIARLRGMITYKAQMAGIKVVEQEESYTSKASFLDNDPLPVLKKDDISDISFSGKRKGRGLYKTSAGKLINADLNGAANILRKARPFAFDVLTDFSFLNAPQIVTFKTLNQCKAVKRIGAA